MKPIYHVRPAVAAHGYEGDRRFSASVLAEPMGGGFPQAGREVNFEQMLLKVR